MTELLNTFGSAHDKPLSTSEIPSMFVPLDSSVEIVEGEHTMDMDHPTALHSNNVPLLHDASVAQRAFVPAFYNLHMPKALIAVILNHLDEPKSQAQQRLRHHMLEYQQNVNSPSREVLQIQLKNEAQNIIQDIVNNLMDDIEISIRNTLEAEFDKWIQQDDSEVRADLKKVEIETTQ